MLNHVYSSLDSWPGYTFAVSCSRLALIFSVNGALVTRIGWKAAHSIGKVVQHFLDQAKWSLFLRHNFLQNIICLHSLACVSVVVIVVVTPKRSEKWNPWHFQKFATSAGTRTLDSTILRQVSTTRLHIYTWQKRTYVNRVNDGFSARVPSTFKEQWRNGTEKGESSERKGTNFYRSL